MHAAIPPSVSVILPVYNGAAFLAEAVASVRAQTHPVRDLQIIVIDDGSTDATAQIAQNLSPAVEFVSQDRNRGPAAARNRGLELCRGDCIGFIDADDLWPADKLAVQLEYFARHPGVELVMGHTLGFEKPGPSGSLYRFTNRSDVVPQLLFLLGAALFRRAVFAKVGSFDERKRYSEDLDLFIRAREAQVEFVVLKETGLIKRCHTDNMTRGKRVSEMGVAAAVRASLERRRKALGVAKPLPELGRA